MLEGFKDISRASSKTTRSVVFSKNFLIHAHCFLHLFVPCFVPNNFAKNQKTAKNIVKTIKPTVYPHMRQKIKPSKPCNCNGSEVFLFGASGRTRTDDLRITNALLYQLSYGSRWKYYQYVTTPIRFCQSLLIPKRCAVGIILCSASPRRTTPSLRDTPPQRGIIPNSSFLTPNCVDRVWDSCYYVACCDGILSIFGGA